MAAERQRSSLDAMGMPVYSRLNSLVALHRGSLITDSDTTGYLRLVCAKGDGATSRAPTGVSAFQPRSRGCGGLCGVGSPSGGGTPPFHSLFFPFLHKARFTKHDPHGACGCASCREGN